MTDVKRTYTFKHKNLTINFEVDSRYKPLGCLGVGAYGIVCAAKDIKNGHKVAIKKIPRAFEVVTIAKRTLRELRILRHFKHDNIICVREIMQPPSDLSSFSDVYVVLDLMETDLHHIIHSNQPLSDEHTRYFLYQILRGLKYIHSANVLHRDLKPSNLLVKANCELKIGDFGMARGLSSSTEEHSMFMTEYVATRWYRAPELMLSLSEYTYSLDMWSVGCICAELLGRRQLFPGKDYLEQLNLILSVVGTPTEEVLSNIGSVRVKSYLAQLPRREKVKMDVLYPGAHSDALNLLDRMLQLKPSDRIEVEDALAHPYLVNYHDTEDEPSCPSKFDFDFEKELSTKDALKDAIIEEIMSYHNNKRPIPTSQSTKETLVKMLKKRGEDKEKGDKDEKVEVKKATEVASTSNRKKEEESTGTAQTSSIDRKRKTVQSSIKDEPLPEAKKGSLQPKKVDPSPQRVQIKTEKNVPPMKMMDGKQMKIIEQQQVINNLRTQLMYQQEQMKQMQQIHEMEMLSLKRSLGIYDTPSPYQHIRHPSITGSPGIISSGGTFSSSGSSSDASGPPIRLPAPPQYAPQVEPNINPPSNPFFDAPPKIMPRYGPVTNMSLGMMNLPVNESNLLQRSISYPGIGESAVIGESTPSLPVFPKQENMAAKTHHLSLSQEVDIKPFDSRLVSPPKTSDLELLAKEAFGDKFLPPFEDTEGSSLISINISSGSGLGYGVGNNDETNQEAQVTSSSHKDPSCPEVEPPPSASLLDEWSTNIDLKLSSEEKDFLIQELEFGSADIFFSDINI